MNKSLLFSLLILTGCTTPYKQYSNAYLQFHPREGYSDYQIDDHTFCVSFRSNLHSKSKLREYVLKRAAEVTLENGDNYFVILSQKQDTQVEYSYSENSTTILQYPDVTLHIRTCKENLFPNAYDATQIIRT